jgi:hypothetical protein
MPETTPPPARNRPLFNAGRRRTPLAVAVVLHHDLLEAEGDQAGLQPPLALHNQLTPRLAVRHRRSRGRHLRSMAI